jgi:hypothetical protein
MRNAVAPMRNAVAPMRNAVAPIEGCSSVVGLGVREGRMAAQPCLDTFGYGSDMS